MSASLISRSDDLQRLWDDGYDIATDGGWLLVRQVPYVDVNRVVRFGTLAVKLTLAGEVTTTPDDHTALFSGAEPCDPQGHPLNAVINSRNGTTDIGGQVFEFCFSQKPLDQGQKRPYQDHHEQVSTYVEILSGHARAVDDAVSPQPVVRLPPVEADYPFVYSDTASARANISGVNRKLLGQVVGVIGLGGTGSYIVDLVAKTYVRELHLWDGDPFLQHNAFRAPGAASVDELREMPSKCEHYEEIYSKIHAHIFAHPYYMNADHFEELDQLDFVFLAVDSGKSRGEIIPALLEREIPFIDVGIGIAEEQGGLAGLVRVTLVEGVASELALEHISMSDGVEDGDYTENVQIADMNALNAVLAVIKWKKHIGVYADLEREWHSVYTIDGNDLDNLGSV